MKYYHNGKEYDYASLPLDVQQKVKRNIRNASLVSLIIIGAGSWGIIKMDGYYRKIDEYNQNIKKKVLQKADINHDCILQDTEVAGLLKKINSDVVITNTTNIEIQVGDSPSFYKNRSEPYLNISKSDAEKYLSSK